jgi:ATP-dependent protease ClpP protease subunit
MTIKQIVGILAAAFFVQTGYSDTFIHKETGATFTGFVTQNTTRGQTRVYNSEEKKFVAVNLSDYDITMNAEGRRQNVILVPITQSEALMSQNVARQIATAIVDASNAGPLAILVQIDNPGGRGEYMKIISSAIASTNNVPVAAFVSGGTYGGAFSSAAVVAMACDKVFIAPTAALGAVGPLVGPSRSNMDYRSYLISYSPDTLVTYSTYVTALAQQHNRPALLVRGFVDKTLSIAEVTNQDGTRDFIKRDDRQPTQTIVRTLTEGLTEDMSGREGGLNPTDIAGAVLNLTAMDAVQYGLADEIAASHKDVLEALGVPSAQIVSAQGIDAIIKKFAAAKRSIATGLAQIERLESQAGALEQSLAAIEEQLRTGTQTREVFRSSRQRNRISNDSFAYYYDDSTLGGPSRSGSRGRPGSRERVTTVEPVANPDVIRAQLGTVLRQLIAEYRRVVNLSERWPGGLPPELPLSALQSNLDSANAQLNNLYTGYTNQSPMTTPNQRSGY